MSWRDGKTQAEITRLEQMAGRIKNIRNSVFADTGRITTKVKKNGVYEVTIRIRGEIVVLEDIVNDAKDFPSQTLMTQLHLIGAFEK